MEMNAHLPQSYQTMEEIKQLAGVPTQIISPRECKPIVAIVQDIALGVYRITKSHVRISEKNLFNILATNPKFNGIAPKPAITNNNVKRWTGRQVLSTIIPRNINIETRSNAYDESKSREENADNIISIQNGEIMSGVFDKDVYQARTKGLVHSIYNECGPEETKDFFDNTQKYICNFLVLDGFSVGVSDLITENKTQDDFQKIIYDMKVKVYETIHKAHAGTLENNTTKNNHENFEKIVNDILNDANKNVGDTGLKRIDGNSNRLLNMIKSKSKGNNINVAQMIGCIGQVNIEGRRIANGFEDRTLPHYTKYDDGPESRGFVENSFIKGLTPQEFFFHAMGGREGLIDTAVGTSETGYIQRKLVKAMEDCKVNYDHSVRNASGAIIQFLYGEDGMDASKIESQPIPYFDMDIEKMIHDYSFSDDLSDEKVFMDPTIVQKLQKSSTWRMDINTHVQQILEDKEFLIVKVMKCRNESSVMYPVSFMRIINNTAGIFNKYNCNVVSDLDPHYALQEIAKLEKEIEVNQHHKGTRLFQLLLRAYMSPKRLITKYRMSQATFDSIMAQVKYRFFESLAHPSEMVGVVAAQSLGEPATQLTLNTFHSAGISSASKTVRGVPRLKELLSVSKNMKTPSMKIYFKNEIGSNRNTCNDLMNDIRTIRFKDIVTSSKIYFDPNDFNSNIEEDREFIALYKEFAAGENKSNLSPWLLRLEFNKKKMHQYHVDMLHVHHTLLDFYTEDNIQCMFSDDNADKLVFRIKMVLNENNSDDMLTELKALEHNIIENIIIKGTKNIEKVSMMKENELRYDITQKKFVKTEEYVVTTDGTNLKDIMTLQDIDPYRTITNDINEIYEVLGIEAARQALYNEICDVLDVIYVNYRHIALLIDVMTNKGNIMPTDRHGINRGDIGPLAKCSFEETTDKLIKAGIFAEYDKINGVSANIMLGQIAPCGTGDAEILIDESKLRSMALEDIMHDMMHGTENEMCSTDALSLKVKMPVAEYMEEKTDNELVIE